MHLSAHHGPHLAVDGRRLSCTSLVRCRAGPGALPVLRCPVGALLVKQVIARARRHRARADRSDEPRRTKYRPVSTRARAVDGTVDGRRMRMEGSQGSEGRTTRWRRVPQHIPNGLPLRRACATAWNTKGHTGPSRHGAIASQLYVLRRGAPVVDKSSRMRSVLVTHISMSLTV